LNLRRLYESIPTQARICTWCNEPILRNIDQDKDGRLYHHGCLLTARETWYDCQECYARFDGTEANFEQDISCFGDDWCLHRKPFCPHCGRQVQTPSQQGVIEI